MRCARLKHQDACRSSSRGWADLKRALMPCLLLGLLLVLTSSLLLTSGCTQAAEPGPPPFPAPLQNSKLPGSAIFDQPTVLDVHVQLGKTNYQALQKHPRTYTPATVVVNGRPYPEVGIKLKGAAGSFRMLDDRPAMTLGIDKYIKRQRLYGLRRIHLNNSVQDPTRLSEFMGSEMFRAAGVPTPRVAWAKVRLNDRDLGLYVVKEGFEKEFLQVFFGNPDGNLYEGGFVRDIDGNLSRESGKGPDNDADLNALREAVHEKDAAKRWEKIQKVLDVDHFLTYAALSVMLVDWDGYAMNRNNYRIYFRPQDGRAVFIPHGMDQLLQRSYMELDAGWSGSVAWAVFDAPEGMKRYEERCRQLFTNIFQLPYLTNRVAEVGKVLIQAEPDMTNHVDNFSYQLQSRYRVLRRDPIIKPYVSPTNTVPVK